MHFQRAYTFKSEHKLQVSESSKALIFFGLARACIQLVFGLPCAAFIRWNICLLFSMKVWHWSAHNICGSRRELLIIYIHYLCNCFYVVRVSCCCCCCLKCRIINSFNICSINDIALLSHFTVQKKKIRKMCSISFFFFFWFVQRDVVLFETNTMKYRVIKNKSIKSSLLASLERSLHFFFVVQGYREDDYNTY